MVLDDPQPEASQVRRRKTLARVGVALVVLSMLLWVPLPVVPFLSLEGEQKMALGGGLFAGAEVAFWLGVLLAGPEAARRTRSWYRGFLGSRRAG